MNKKRNLFNIAVIGIFFCILFNIESYSLVQGVKTVEEKKIKGTIYLGDTIFGKIDLESKKWSAIYDGSNYIYCRFPNIVNKSLFIVETEGKKIEYFDALTSKFLFITEGINPVYAPEIRSIFYYKYGQGVFQKFLDGDKEEKLISNNIRFSTSLFQGPIILISPEEIAYYNKEKKIEIYNYIKLNYRLLDMIGFEPCAFYVNKNSLICKNEADKALYFIDVVSSNKNKIPITNSQYIESAIIPINAYNCFVYSKYRSGLAFWESEYKDAWIYWVDSNEEEKLINNFNISYGFYTEVVYK